jgi:branched-chain amino acid transport system substrate-binding protein
MSSSPLLTRRTGLGLTGAALLPLGAARAADDLVRIGAAVSLTGKLSREGNQLKNGYVYWEKLVNDAGGIEVAGKKIPVKVFYYDDESEPQISARLTERCITEDKVGFMFGPYSSGVATATASISEKYRVPMMTAMATADSLYTRGYRYIFCPSPIASGTLDPLLDLLKTLPAPAPATIAIAGPDDLFPNVFAAAAVKKAESLGLKIVYNGKYPKSAADLSAVATALKENTPDVLILTGYVQDSVLMVKTLQSLKVNPKLIGFAFAVGIPDVLTALGPAAEDLFGVAIWEPSLSYKGPVVADSATYVKGYRAMFNAEPNYLSASGTASGIVLQQAITAAGTLEPAKVRDALSKLDFQTFFGNVKFNERGVDIAASAVVAQVQNGKAVPVFPKEIQAAPINYPRKPFA